MISASLLHCLTQPRPIPFPTHDNFIVFELLLTCKKRKIIIIMDTGAETPNSDLEALLFFHKTFFKFCKLFAQKIWFSMSFARLSAQKSWFSSGFAIFLHTNNGFLNSASFLRKTVAFLRFCKLFAQKHVFSLDFVSFGNKTLSHAFCGKPLVFLEFRKLFAQKQMFSLGFCTLSEQLFRRRPKK